VLVVQRSKKTEVRKTMKLDKVKTLALLATVMCAVTACSGGSSTRYGPECGANSSCPHTNDPLLPEALFGTWKTACESNGEGTTFTLSEWRISSVDVVVSHFRYDPSDVTCSNVQSTEIITYDATYLADTQPTELGTAVKADLLVVGYTAQDNTGVFLDSAVDGVPDDVGNEYQIYIVSNNSLYGGRLSSGDATTPATRPTEIDLDFGLTRE
jgi:hypothetical protein